MPSSDSSGGPTIVELSPTLRGDSEHERPLLKFFALHRLATAYLIQDAFPHLFDTHTKTMRHLHRLHNQGYLRRHNNDAPYIFGITQLGYQRCRDFKEVDPRFLAHRYKQPSGKQSDHELLITRAAVGIYKYVRSTSNVDLLEEGRFMLGNIEYADPDTGEVTYPFDDRIPDYWYVCRIDGVLYVRFVEVFMHEESPVQIRKKLEEYHRWSLRPGVKSYLNNLYSKWGAKNPRPDFQVHCILDSKSWQHTDAWKERTTMMQSFQVDVTMQKRLWTVSRGAIDETEAIGGTIGDAIWHRGRDLVSKQTEWKRSRPGERTLLVDSLMRQIPTHPLFA